MNRAEELGFINHLHPALEVSGQAENSSQRTPKTKESEGRKNGRDDKPLH